MKIQHYLTKKQTIENYIIDDLTKSDFISHENFIFKEILRRVEEKLFKLFLDESIEANSFYIIQT